MVINMISIVSKNQKMCGNCEHWLGGREKRPNGSVAITSPTAGCSLAGIKNSKYNPQQSICNAKAGKDLYQYWGGK